MTDTQQMDSPVIQILPVNESPMNANTNLPPPPHKKAPTALEPTSAPDSPCPSNALSEENISGPAESEGTREQLSLLSGSKSNLCRDVSEHMQTKNRIGLGERLRIMFKNVLPDKESVAQIQVYSTLTEKHPESVSRATSRFELRS